MIPRLTTVLFTVLAATSAASADRQEWRIRRSESACAPAISMERRSALGARFRRSALGSGARRRALGDRRSVPALGARRPAFGRPDPAVGRHR
jgi:hypothetical protein